MPTAKKRVQFDSSALAEAAFYEAFAQLDGALMSQVWLDSERVYCVHPGSGPLLGSEQVLNSWRSMFDQAAPVALFYRVISSQVSKRMALHLVEEEISAADGSHRALVMATNCYLNTSEGWRLASHHASPRASAPQERDHLVH